MAVTFTNNFKNILDKLESVLESEFGNAVPVSYGSDDFHGSQYIKLLPTGNTLISYTNSSDEREYSVKIVYYFNEKFIKTKTFDHILRFVSRIEALVHDNQIMTLDKGSDADNSKALNCRVVSTKLANEPIDGKYFVDLNWVCQHIGNFN